MPSVNGLLASKEFSCTFSFSSTLTDALIGVVVSRSHARLQALSVPVPSSSSNMLTAEEFGHVTQLCRIWGALPRSMAEFGEFKIKLIS